MQKSSTVTDKTAVLRPLGNIHHLALRCRDAEQTRWFYEDVLGLTLAAALSLENSPGTEKERPFLHLFLELGDGNYIAFFDEPGHAKPEQFEIKDSFDIHIAFETENIESMLAWKDKISAAGDFIFGPIDHEFVESVYFFDPNGYALEITHKTAKHDAVLLEEKSNARQQIAEWSARTRAKKIEIFGADAIDSRCSALLAPHSDTQKSPSKKT
jgi:catechol 2,3-dioxygenase-like lactoylglutathione lyase family enzyme